MNETPVVLITGSARRIGAGIAEYFHNRGWRILIHYNHSMDDAESVAARFNSERPESALTLQADLCSDSQLQSLAAEAVAGFGRVDTLVNNASSFYPTPLDKVSPADWDQLVGSNLRGAYFLSQAMAQELRQHRGSIINIIDTHADQPLKGYSVYTMAKAGLKAMTRALAVELAPNVRVNGVSPGAILWPSSLSDDQDAGVIEEREHIIQQIPLGCLGSPANIAAAVWFLATDASYVTGEVIRVDGGRRLAT